MYYFVLHVLHDQEKLEPLMDAWKGVGVKGMTILQSIGMCQIQEEIILRDDLPLLPTLNSLFETGETLNRTLFTVLEGDDLLEKVITETEAVVGDLNLPGTGILVVMPVVRALGLHRKAE